MTLRVKCQALYSILFFLSLRKDADSGIAEAEKIPKGDALIEQIPAEI